MANGLLMHLESSRILSLVISPHDVNSAFLFFSVLLDAHGFREVYPKCMESFNFLQVNQNVLPLVNQSYIITPQK